MLIVHLDDPLDPRLEPYLRLRERDVVGRQGRFVAEGRVVVETLLGARSRFEVESLLVSQRALTSVRELLEARLEAGVPVYCVADAVLRETVGFDLHRGLLALGRRAEAPTPSSLLATLGDGPCTLLAAEGLTNHDNVGAILRNAAALGADGVLFDQTCCDPLYRKALRVSVGHALTVPWSRSSTSTELVAALQAHGVHVAALALRPSARALTGGGLRPASRVAILLGSEGPGLSDAAIEAADSVWQIPMAAGVDSLNVATAAAIALFGMRCG